MSSRTVPLILVLALVMAGLVAAGLVAGLGWYSFESTSVLVGAYPDLADPAWVEPDATEEVPQPAAGTDAERGHRKRAELPDAPDEPAAVAEPERLAAASESGARAADPDAFSLANEAVEKIRDDVHREKMVVVWPDPSELPHFDPPDGAEVWLIWGYLDYDCALVTWRGGVAEGLYLEEPRGAAQTIGAIKAGAFTLPRDVFVRAWRAAALVRGASAKRREPAEETRRFGASSGGGSHEQTHWVRVSVLDAEAPLTFAAERGSSSRQGIRNWSEIQNRAAFTMLRDAALEAPRSEQPVSVWTRFFTDEVLRTTPLLEPGFGSIHQSSLLTALRALGEAGDRASLEAVRELRGRLRDPKLAQGHDFVRWAAEATEWKLQMRLDWDAEAAARSIVAPPSHYSQERLAAWTRTYFRDRDPEGLTAVLREALLDPATDPLVARSSASALRDLGERGLDVLREVLGHTDVSVRVTAATALLEADETDAGAREVLAAVARDSRAVRPSSARMDRSLRGHALARLLEIGAFEDADLRSMLAADHEDGRMVRHLIKTLEERGAVVTNVERRDAFRRVLDGPRDRGLVAAIRELIELDDRPSFERIATLLDEMQQAHDGVGRDPLGRWMRDRTIPELREKLAD